MLVSSFQSVQVMVTFYIYIGMGLTIVCKSGNTQWRLRQKVVAFCTTPRPQRPQFPKNIIFETHGSWLVGQFLLCLATDSVPASDGVSNSAWFCVWAFDPNPPETLLLLTNLTENCLPRRRRWFASLLCHFSFERAATSWPIENGSLSQAALWH